jgi:hypothetical protein
VQIIKKKRRRKSHLPDAIDDSSRESSCGRCRCWETLVDSDLLLPLPMIGGSCLISSSPLWAFDDFRLLRPRQHGELHHIFIWNIWKKQNKIASILFSSSRIFLTFPLHSCKEEPGPTTTSLVPFIIRHLNSDKHSVGKRRAWLSRIRPDVLLHEHFTLNRNTSLNWSRCRRDRRCLSRDCPSCFTSCLVAPGSWWITKFVAHN